ncbi:DUF4062 domain-containing protein [Tenacibaculum finnmarkense]|uniref:DUF4062 domain-containing protein n=1 Tax=Tenacibaculum finnmarkense TaxID=2781243 RepID=UPI001E574F7D|nr:DUF4062 domain-containing protein [Tenacibaculum finnmarkense]MCD8413634.1 DUF4062 domain-containing protein [Tenacibaculum finnmarkense genomovar ulcerans]
MAKPRIFISSTFYDLKQIRSDLNQFIENLGYETIRNEEGNIPYGKEEALGEYCYKEIKNVDILISIIGGRFGSESKRNNSSISNLELKTAIKEGKQVYIFIDKHVYAEYETYLLNKENPIKFRYVDDIRIYKFIEEIKSLGSNNNIKSFETASEITIYLKEQFAGLFQRFLENQSRIKEVSLINNLEKTANTLNKLVNYISDENKDKTKEINQILTINHPLVNEIRNELSIQYNFYIEGTNDLNLLLQARGYERDLFTDDDEYFYWEKSDSRNYYTIRISKEIFDDIKLKFLKTNEWEDRFFQTNTAPKTNEEPEDLPF